MNIVGKLKTDNSIRMSQQIFNDTDKTIKTMQINNDMVVLGYTLDEFNIIEMTDEELKTAIAQ